MDEAFNQLDARAVAGGWRPVFLPANAGREVLYTYLQAALSGLFGDSIAVLRAASALAGSLAIPALWLAARALAPAGTTPRRVALLAAAILAGSFWHLHFSRFGIRAVLFVPVVCAVAWAWQRTVRAPAGRGRRAAALTGALVGLAAYVHPAGRGLFALPLAHAVWLRAMRRDAAVLGRLAISFGCMLVVAAPLILFWMSHPSLFFGHAGEVSILGEGPARLAANAARVAGSFFVAGDPAGWRNLPGRPAFDAAVGAAFVLGIAHSARAALGGREARPDDRAALALLWLAVLLVPSIVTDAAPNFSRAIGALPAACVLAAVGVERAGAWIGGRPALGERARAVSLAVMLAVPLYAGLRATVDYFGVWATDPQTAIAFDADVRDLATWAMAESEVGAAVFLSPSTASHATVRAVAGDRPPGGVDLTSGLVLSRAAADGGGADGTLRATYAFLDRLPWERRQIAALEARASRFGIALGVEASAGRTLVRASTTERDLLTALSPYPGARRLVGGGGSVALEAAHGPRAVVPGEPFTITLLWSAERPTTEPLHTAVQLLDASGQLVASGDARPLDGAPPTDRWRAGDWILASHTLEWIELEEEGKGESEGDELELRIGWYALSPDGAGGWRATGLPWSTGGDDLATIGRLRVSGSP